jgi:hypothetical protein
MSSIFGAVESPLISTRVRDTPPPPDKPKYHFSLMQWLLDKFFPARALHLEADRSDTSPTRS